MLNALILGRSYDAILICLCEDRRRPHVWENPSNACGNVSVQMHGYSGGHIGTLISAIYSGLFFHHNPQVVEFQIGSNDCSAQSFDVSHYLFLETDLKLKP